MHVGSRWRGGVVVELDDGVARLNDLESAWAFDLDVVLDKRARQAPAAGDGGGRTAWTNGLFQGGALDASSAPLGRVQTAETSVLCQAGAV